MFNFIKRYIKRNYGIDKEYFRFIDDMFGFIPNNIELYKVALIHKSASQSIGGHHINNERLEYLGDAVIESITSDYLFIAYPDRDEGFLTQMRSKIVSRQSLNEMAVFIGLDKYLICNSSATLQQKHIYGDAFEAMMGAIYLDKGYEFTNRLLINDIFERFLSIDALSEEENDFKSRLIEWCQKSRHTLEFKTRKEMGKKSAAPIFYTTVLIDGIEMGHGTGDSKKSSEQKAACSVSHEMSDEECAKILDKFDRMMRSEDTGKASTAQNGATKDNPAAVESEQSNRDRQERKHRRNKRKKPQDTESANTLQTENREEERPEKASEGSDIPFIAPEPHSDEESVVAEQKPAKRRNTRNKKQQNNTPEAAQSNTAANDEPSNADTTLEQPAKKRRSRKKSAATGEETATETSTEAATEQPQKKRRTYRRKSQQNTGNTESVEQSATASAESQE